MRGERQDWREVVEEAAEATGILRDDGVLLPNSDDPHWWDNAVYYVAGYAQREIDVRGFDDVSSWEVLAYTFELLIPGSQGHFDEILAHIAKHGWGCPLSMRVE